MALIGTSGRDGMGELCRLAGCEVLEVDIRESDAYVFGRKLTPSQWESTHGS
jgi:hypothetical protein